MPDLSLFVKLPLSWLLPHNWKYFKHIKRLISKLQEQDQRKCILHNEALVSDRR